MTRSDERQQAGPLQASEPGSARRLVNEMTEAGVLDDLMDRVDRGGVALTGQGGFLPELVKAVFERGLAVQLFLMRPAWPASVTEILLYRFSTMTPATLAGSQYVAS